MPDDSAGSALEYLGTLVGELDQLAWDFGPEHISFRILHEIAATFSGVHQELEDHWVYNDPEGDVPTPAQGIALARFLRPHFNSDRSHWFAGVSRGGAGLGNDYLHVRLSDGYEGGIDKAGRTST